MPSETTLAYSLLFFACVSAAYLVRTDCSRSDIPPGPVIFVALLAAAWWASAAVRPEFALSEALVRLAIPAWIVVFIAAQKSVNAAYAKTLFVFTAFFWAFGKAALFLEAFLAAFVLATAARSIVFFAGIAFDPVSRRSVRKHFSEGVERANRGRTAAAIIAAALYVVAAKAVFGAAGSAWFLEGGRGPFFAAAFLVSFPFAVAFFERAFSKKRTGKHWAVGFLAVAAVSLDFAVSWFDKAMASLPVSILAWLAVSAGTVFVFRYFKFYLETENSSVVKSCELVEWSLIDEDFFHNRFLPGKTRLKPFGKMDAEKIEAVRGIVAEAVRQNPNIPDEIRIVKRVPLAPYVFVAVLVASVSAISRFA